MMKQEIIFIEEIYDEMQVERNALQIKN